MKSLLLAGCALLLATLGHAQTITILDAESKTPLSLVTVVSDEASAVTDSTGTADISAFVGASHIEIRRLGYGSFTGSYDDLVKSGFVISLQAMSTMLGEVRVAPHQWTGKKMETPNRIEKIDMKEAAFQNPQTAADLLGMSGYAFIQKSQLGGGSPMLRGMATNRVLLVVDGVRMNTAIFRAGNLQNVISLDANAIESSEILFGPGSVKYGSDAIGGVMSFYTLVPRFSADSTPVVSGNAMSRFSTANAEKTGHLDLNIGFRRVAFVSSVTYSDYDDLRSGAQGGVPYFYRPSYVITIDDKDYMVDNEDSTLQVGSAYSQINAMQKVLVKPTKHWSIDYGFQFSETSEYNRYDRLYVVRTDGPYKNKLRWAEWYYGPQKWRMHRVGAVHTRRNAIYNRAQLVGAYQFFEESRYDREFMFRERMMQKEQVRAWSLNLDLDKKVTAKISLNYGAEAVYNRIQSVATLTYVVTDSAYPTVTRYPDGSIWESYGAYLTARYSPHEKWNFSAGVRYNRYYINAQFDSAFFPFPFAETHMESGNVSGSMGFVFSPQPTWQIYANASTGFRAPNIDDMGKVFESVPGYLVVPNPGLRPEQVVNTELGMVKSFGPHIKFDVTGYYTWLFDAMVRKDFALNGDTTLRFLGNKSRIQAVQNVTQIQVYGLQAGIQLSLKGFGLRSNISFQEGREQTPDSLVYYPLRHAAPTFGSTHLYYERPKFKTDFYAVYNAGMDPEDLALTERTNASYARDSLDRAYVLAWYTLNFKAAYYPTPSVALTAGVENILNLLYRPYASGINAPGRNYIISLRVKF